MINSRQQPYSRYMDRLSLLSHTRYTNYKLLKIPIVQFLAHSVVTCIVLWAEFVVKATKRSIRRQSYFVRQNFNILATDKKVHKITFIQLQYDIDRFLTYNKSLFVTHHHRHITGLISRRSTLLTSHSRMVFT